MTTLEYKPTHYSDTFFKGRGDSTECILLFKKTATNKAGRVFTKICAETFPNLSYMLQFIDQNEMQPLSEEEWSAGAKALHIANATNP